MRTVNVVKSFGRCLVAGTPSRALALLAKTGRVALLPVRAWRGLPACSEDEGQGTTEYAILVGVLVVIAIVAIVAFRGRIQTLWDTIATSINNL